MSGVALMAGVVAVASVSTPPVLALTCAPHPEASPEAILEGREELASGTRFFAHHDYAITGTVTTITTNEDRDSDTYGFTQLRVEVINAFGIDEVPPVVTISQLDPGWLHGYPFSAGTTYFIPVDVRRGPTGDDHWTHVCDPIAELSVGAAEDLATRVSADIVVATMRAVPEPQALNGLADESASASAPQSESSSTGESGRRSVVAAAALGSTAAITVAFALLVRRRRPIA